MKKLIGVSTLIVLISGVTVRAVTVQENSVFPDRDVIISQQVGVQPIGVRDIDDGSNVIDAKLGQTFSLETETTLRAITIKSHNTRTWGVLPNDILDLWIGENTGTPTAFVAGATNLQVSINLSNVTVVAERYYTFNLDSDVVLPPGNYAFQFAWQATSPDGTHQWFMRRAAGDSTYTNGTATFVQTLDGTPVAFPADGGNVGTDSLVFGLHSKVVGTVPTLSVDPEEVFIFVDPLSGGFGSASVDVSFASDTTVDINPSISEESHPGAFPSWSFVPQTLFESPTSLEWFFDNSVANLPVGGTATGLVTIAWNETGSTITNEVLVPISAFVGFAAGETNIFTGKVSANWGAATNWSLGRVPGAAGSDVGVIESGSTVVATNFVGSLPWDTVIRGGATLNVGADLLNAGALLVGSEDGQHGFVSQTNGTVAASSLEIGEVSDTAPANSVYTLSGGTLALAVEDGAPPVVIQANGLLDINGGTFSIDQGPANATITGPGFVKLESGTLTSAGTVASDVLNFNAPLEITGGSVLLNGQNKFRGGIKVVGDAASIVVNRWNSHGGASVDAVFVMGEHGISPVTNNNWIHLRETSITVDGANYVGGSGTFPLFQTGNLATTTTNVVITNFLERLTVTVEQNQDTGEVLLTIFDPEAKGYDAWIAGYGLSGADAARDFDFDGDGEDNFYEYGFGGDPTDPAVQGYVSSGAAVEDGGTPYLEYVYPRRVGSQEETGLLYEPLFATDPLGDWSSDGVVELSPAGAFDADYEAVTNRVDMTGRDVGFMRLRVSEP